VLIELKQTGLKTDKGLVIEDDPFLVVHPNYVIDSSKFSWSKFSIKNFGQVLDKTFDRVNGL
jgi:hypothetical protein